MSAQPQKMCPFTLSFAVPIRGSIAGPGGPASAELRVGLPCAGSKCMWWSMKIQDCVVFEILYYISFPHNEGEDWKRGK